MRIFLDRLITQTQHLPVTLFWSEQKQRSCLCSRQLDAIVCCQKDRKEMDNTIADTRRLFTKPQNLNDAYGPPSNFLEIDVSNPETIGVGRGKFTTYEVKLKVSQ